MYWEIFAFCGLNGSRVYKWAYTANSYHSCTSSYIHLCLPDRSFGRKLCVFCFVVLPLKQCNYFPYPLLLLRVCAYVLSSLVLSQLLLAVSWPRNQYAMPCRILACWCVMETKCHYTHCPQWLTSTSGNWKCTCGLLVPHWQCEWQRLKGIRAGDYFCHHNDFTAFCLKPGLILLFDWTQVSVEWVRLELIIDCLFICFCSNRSVFFPAFCL